MRGYIITKEKNEYRFELMPINSNYKPMGRSCLYKNRDECIKGLKEFATFIKKKKINKEIDGILEIKQNDNKFYFEYIKDSKIIFERTMGYYSKDNCLKAIDSIYRNIEEYTSKEKSID